MNEPAGASCPFKSLQCTLGRGRGGHTGPSPRVRGHSEAGEAQQGSGRSEDSTENGTREIAEVTQSMRFLAGSSFLKYESGPSRSLPWHGTNPSLGGPAPKGAFPLSRADAS